MRTFALVAVAVAVALTSLGACSQDSASSGAADKSASTQSAAMDTKTKAVLIYADWCGSCKILDPALEEARSMKLPSGVEFVTLDFTNKDETQFYTAADEAGVGKAVRAHLNGTVKTGQLLLIDVDDETVITKVDKTYDAASIVVAIEKAVAAS